MLQHFTTDEDFALRLDKEDPLSGFRERFYVPPDTIYVDGNSLGLLSKDAERSLLRVLNEWKTMGIKGWLEAERPWFYFAEEIGLMASALVGAEPEELMLTGTTTVNIHSLISTFYNPSGRKTKILADELNFPSDIYALKGQIKMKGFDPYHELILAPANNGMLEEKTIVEMMTDEVALIFLPSVVYRSGQLLDMKYLTAQAHKRNIVIGFDCSHSVGAVPHHFSKWEIDFAIFCSYKYLNGGPGCAAFLYLNKMHFDKEPLMAGWFGCRKDRQFDMSLDFDHSPNAGGWQISSPGILGTSPVEGAIRLILEAGIDNIREKSLQMTSYLIYLVQQLISMDPYKFIICTPLEPHRRSGHVAIGRIHEAFRINEALKAKGVIPDFRPPNIIRLAPIALYNTYHEIWKVVNYLKEIIDNNEYEKYPSQRKAIS